MKASDWIFGAIIIVATILLMIIGGDVPAAPVWIGVIGLVGVAWLKGFRINELEREIERLRRYFEI